ncbi:hypothetical protein AWB80_08153 [Caballeronia pedi]|uniref:Uncharacterized protein n=1 Tax=Caballeronia pedi TaxID=1777141 RepID=A0A158E3Z3_9BURK|nr:hypothetical protein [Caballeronia pedi]SAL01558.1 hypothetical protein AWB80_08153 [Caballeronia pedi]
MQTKTQSLIETLLNTALGYGINLSAQIAIFPLFGIHIAFHESAMIGVAFTGISIARGFALRRLFNWIHSVRPAKA